MLSSRFGVGIHIRALKYENFVEKFQAHISASIISFSEGIQQFCYIQIKLKQSH